MDTQKTKTLLKGYIIFIMLILTYNVKSQISPANPNASEDVGQILNWLTTLEGDKENGVIVGQHIGPVVSVSPNFDDLIDDLYSSYGKRPALVGIGSYTGYGNEHIKLENYGGSKIVDFWDDGGLIEADAHWGNPWTQGNSHDKNNVNIPDLYLSAGSSAAKTRFWDQVSRTADDLEFLQDNDVVVFFRPLHEVNGRWFWWSEGGQSQYKNLWEDVFYYMTTTRSLNNIIWYYSPSGLNTTSKQDPHTWYPGDDYVDVIGLDNYNTSIENSGYDENMATLDTINKVWMGFGEWGPNTYFDFTGFLDQVEDDYPEVKSFLCWSNGSNSILSSADPEGVLDHYISMTQDEVDWQSYSGGGSGNLLTNPGFETGSMSPWSMGGGFAIDNSNQRTGSYSVYRNFSGSKKVTDQEIAISEGEEYTARVYLKNTSSTGTAKLRLAFRNSGGTVVQWGGSSLIGNTSGSYQLIEVTGTAPTNTVSVDFGCFVEDNSSNGTAYFDDAEFYKGSESCTEPSITNDPDNETVEESENATFSVTSSGTTPLSYQWQKDGTNISGATSSSYTINNAQASDAGDYRCITSNSCGADTSSVATLTVNSSNLLTNPGFETGSMSPWSTGGGFAIDNSNQRTGSYSVYRNFSGSKKVTDQEIAISEGEEYTARVYLKNTSSTGTAKLRLAFRNSGGTVVQWGGSSLIGNTSGSYQLIEVTGTAPTNTASVDFGCFVEDNSSNGTAYFDDAEFTIDGSGARVAAYNNVEELENDKKAYKVYPVPVNDILTITVNKSEGPFHYKVVDMNGRKMVSGKINDSHFEINTYPLSRGLYFLHLTSKEIGTRVYKVTKD